MGFFLNLLIGLLLQVVAYLITPKPKQEATETANMDNPTAEAGKPMPKPFGTITIKGLNCLHSCEKHYVKHKVRV